MKATKISSKLISAPALWLAMLLPVDAWAIRPFVNDDARVVGKGLAQVESWLVGDENQLTHNIFGAIGPTDWLEITAGVAHGSEFERHNDEYSVTGPVFQLKALTHEAEPNGLPGLAFAAGVVSPFGSGHLKPAGPGAFAYAALTEALFDENLLLHANLGFAGADAPQRWKNTITTGAGFQAKLVAGLHAVGEIYYGDPYDPLSATGESQVGFRYIVNDTIQFDGTVGKNIEGPREEWWTLGIRLVSSPLW